VTSSPRQLTFRWPHTPSFAREDFLTAASNREASRAIELWPSWPGRMLALVGPEGAGKSHLGAIWARSASAITLHGDALDVDSLDACIHAPAVLIENADRAAQAEDVLFHAVNAALENGRWLMLTSRAAPDAWGLKLPDLLSRLRLAPIARLETPDVELTEAVLFKLFSDRQLQVDPHVVAYIALRLERSLGAARQIVAALDEEALTRGRRVTRAMAAEALYDLGAYDLPSTDERS
jgi:chromosomal replication initiation ATPase DnaA